MSKRKKWPHYAEWARTDSIALFDAIRTQLRESQKIMLTSPMEAMLLIGQAADKALDGAVMLQRAKDAPEEGEP